MAYQRNPVDTVLQKAAQETRMRGQSSTIGDVLPRVNLNETRKDQLRGPRTGKGPRKPNPRDVANELRGNRRAFKDQSGKTRFGIYE